MSRRKLFRKFTELGIHTYLAGPPCSCVDRYFRIWFLHGPIWPVVITMASNTIQMRGTITGMFYLESSLRAMSLPWIIDQLISHLGPAVIIVCIFISIFFSVGTVPGHLKNQH